MTKNMSDSFCLKCTLLGTGTSHGIPVIGCSCPRCVSLDPRDKRTRTGLWFQCRNRTDGTIVSAVVDTGPEFRTQALTHNIDHIDAVFITHSHADHLHGIDDLRVFSCPEHCAARQHLSSAKEEGLPVYSNASVLNDIRIRFPYVFGGTIPGGGKPCLCLKQIDAGAVCLGKMTVRAVPLIHGNAETTGWMFTVKDAHGAAQSIVVLTDCKYIPESSLSILRTEGGCIRHLIIDGLRPRPHQTHLSFEEALRCAVAAGAQHIWLTHICHDMTHREIEKYISDMCKNDRELKYLTENGRTAAPAYDGLTLEI